jgi:hypothetical protein
MFYQVLKDNRIIDPGQTGELFDLTVKRIGDIQLSVYCYFTAKVAGDYDVVIHRDGVQIKRFLLDCHKGLNILPLVWYGACTSSQYTVSVVNQGKEPLKFLGQDRTGLSVVYCSPI